MPHHRLIFAALTLALMLGGATTILAPSGQAHTLSTPERGNACPSVPPTTTPVTKPLTPIFDTRTTEERATAYTQGFQDFQTRRAEWIREFQRRGRDASQLPRVLRAASYVPPERTLSDALRRADLVVEGQITRVVHTPTGSIGTLRIIAQRKISPEATALLGTPQPLEVDMSMGYSVEPDAGFSQCEGKLGYGEPTPVLFPGARAVFLLQLTRATVPDVPPFYPQNFTGVYESDANGLVVPVRDNPFGGEVGAYTTAGFLARIEDELRGM